MRPGWLAAGLILWLSAAAPLAAAPPAVEPAAEGTPPGGPAATASIGDPAYLTELVAAARARRLWEQRLWQLLLHYRPDWVGGGFTSEADGPGFFNAPDGKTDPQAELEATLAAFFSTRILEPGKQTAQCTFVARFHWLDARLGFDPARLPRLPCKRFDAWRTALDPDSVSLIFAAHYFNSPGSMFGHTLLVLNKRGRPASERMLNYAINFGASVPPEDNILFAVKGLIGSYEGYFSLLPYYAKIREYNDMESRDIWEYRLNFTQPQVDRLVRHAWEMGSTYYDYYFLKENCSYHLLSLLEVADPALHLRDRFHLWAIPADTIRALLEHEGVLAQLTYRPSRGTRLNRKLAALTGPERQIAYAVIDDAAALEAPPFLALPRARQAMVLDTAVDDLQLRIADAPEKASATRAALRRLLAVRSRYDVPPPPENDPRDAVPPEQGHRSARVVAGAGQAVGRQGFVDVSLQPAYHDLLSADEGFPPYSQIHAFLVQARHEQEPARTRLEQFTLLDVVSLAPMQPLVHRPSFRVRTGWFRSRDGVCANCMPFVVEGGFGLSLGSTLFDREVWFAMAEAAIEADDALEKGYRAGLGARAGLVVDFSHGWRAELAGSTVNFSAGDKGEVQQAELRQRFSITTNLEVNWDLLWVERYREWRLGLGYYF